MACVVDPQPDVAHTLAVALLGHIMDRLEAQANPPKRAFIVNGVGIPADDCCEGLLWVRVAEIVASDGNGNAWREMWNAPAGPPGHIITIETGVLRCSSVLNEDGTAPSPDDYTATALQASSDRQAVRLALLCDFPPDIIAAQCDGQILSAWTPMDEADCNGGYMTTIVGTSMVI